MQQRVKFYTCDRSTDGKTRYFVKSKLSENIHETPEGYLVCLGVPIARTGEMVYGEGETPLEVDDAGQVLIQREEEEVFRSETIASFEGKPVTITHPTEFVSPNNWSTLAKGTIQNVRRGEGENKNDLVADLLITDSVAIGLVKNGLREVSCGYEADYHQTGDGRGIQKNIVGNHVALVDKGRAGSSYAINDHKGTGAKKMKISEKIKAIFAKAQDEAMKAAEDAEQDPPPAKKDDDKGKAKDDAEDVAALKAKIKELQAKLADAEKTDDEDGDDKEKESKDDDDNEANLGDRLKALETAVAKILEKLSDEDDEEDDEESDESEDDGEMVGDEDDGKAGKTGDTASRIEILSPGMNAKAKDAKAKALKAAYATKDGKKVIDQLTGGKAPTYDSAEKVNTLFIAASELLKVARASDFSKTKQGGRQTTDSDEFAPIMTADAMNEFNRKHYNRA